MSTKRFLNEVLEPSTVKGYYQPLAMISLMLDYAAGGRENNLRPFHVTSLSLHTANTALIIALLYMLFGNIWAAAAAGLLFGVHPLTVEPIPWVGERKTLLAAFFALWSLILYVRYSRGGGWKFYTGCFVMYLLALMSKPTSLPLPAVMLLMDYWPLKRLSVKSFWEKLPLFVLAGVFAVITYISQHRTGGTISPAKYEPWHIPLVLCHNIIFYLYKIILPINLSSHYAFPKPFGLSNTMVLAGVIGTCILIPILLVSLRWTRAALTGWLIFFAAIFPTMGIVGFTNVIASDKYAYLPSIGLLMIVTTLLIWIGKSNKFRTAAVAFVLILASAEATATQRYLVCWKDTITLAQHMVLMSPDSAIVYQNLGFAYGRLGRNEEEIEVCKKAVKIKPDYAEAYNSLGAAYYRIGRIQDAINAYQQTIKNKPDYVDAYNNLSVAYVRLGRFQDAVDVSLQAIKLKPDFVKAYNSLGTAYNKLGRYPEAIENYRQAIRLNPGYVTAHYNLGQTYLAAGDRNFALEEFKILQKLDMTKANLLFNDINK